MNRECCGKEKDDVLEIQRCSGDGNWGITKPYTDHLCERCEEEIEFCIKCGVGYDDIAWSRSEWANAIPDWDENTEKITEDMEMEFFCDECVFEYRKLFPEKEPFDLYGMIAWYAEQSNEADFEPATEIFA